MEVLLLQAAELPHKTLPLLFKWAFTGIMAWRFILVFYTPSFFKNKERQVIGAKKLIARRPQALVTFEGLPSSLLLISLIIYGLALILPGGRQGMFEFIWSEVKSQIQNGWEVDSFVIYCTLAPLVIMALLYTIKKTVKTLCIFLSIITVVFILGIILTFLDRDVSLWVIIWQVSLFPLWLSLYFALNGAQPTWGFLKSSAFKSGVITLAIFVAVGLLIWNFLPSEGASTESDYNYAFVVVENTEGLPIRKTPSIDAEQDPERFVPKLTSVIVLDSNVKRDVIQGRRGHWVKVLRGADYTGYMFDGWLAYEDEVIDLVKSFISHLGKQEFEKAHALQNFLSLNAFVSNNRGYGGIRKTKILEEPEVKFKVIKPGVLEVHVKYLSVDVINDKKYCDTPGIIYRQLFEVKKGDAGLVIIGINQLSRECKNGTPISDGVNEIMGGIVVDPDGSRYKTLNLLGQTWLIENLKYNVPGSYCYERNSNDCEKYGRFYGWDAAIRACRGLGNGWRLPNYEDWAKLATYYGGFSDESARDKGDGKETYKSLIEGGQSGFDTKFVGIGFEGKEFRSMGEIAYFWSSTDRADLWAYRLSLFKDYERTSLGLEKKGFSLSCRCIKDN